VSALVNRMQWIARVATGRTNAGRGLTVFPDDVYLVSYPRSGNTWARFLIANLVARDNPPSFADIEARIPAINLWPDRTLRRVPRPRILKSHEYFDPRYKQVIYIVRDPRDVAVSCYHYAIKRRDLVDGYPLEQFVPRFIAAEFFSDFANWGDHVRSWLGTRRGEPRFLLLRYEEMLASLELELTKLASFLHVDITPERLSRCAELSSAERLRELERKQSKEWKLTRKTRQDKPFVRAAGAGGWKQVLSPQSVAQIESAWGPLMRELGYELMVTANSAATDRKLAGRPSPQEAVVATADVQMTALEKRGG
jgi:Sulfotransferase domain